MGEEECVGVARASGDRFWCRGGSSGVGLEALVCVGVLRCFIFEVNYFFGLFVYFYFYFLFGL